jgi:hypothetical protein
MTEETKAYIAGFLDGDGCIMLQLVYRRDYVLGYQIRASIVFYQKQQYRDFLEWLQDEFDGVGYIRNRNDGMSEYAIVGIENVRLVLLQLISHLKLKRVQAEITLNVISQMPGSGRKMEVGKLISLSKEVDRFLELNYSKKRTNTSIKLAQFLKSHNLIP